MHKTTVYLPDDLRSELLRAARATGHSEAHLIREGVRQIVRTAAHPVPTAPLFRSGHPHLVEHVDEALAGFGE